MRSKNIIHMISCHAEGEVGNVIVGGVSPPPGDTLWQQARWIDEDQGLRNLVLNEPRGGVFKHINLLVPAKQHRSTVWIHYHGAGTHPANVGVEFDLRRHGITR